ncbi:MAG: AAA family ATPase [Oligosphaeraceae bacterium]
MGKIRRISIQGFKSIKSLTDFELRDLNIVIGANGAGKSNLMQLFEMLFSMSYGGFQKYVLLNGEANVFCHNGQKTTKEIFICLDCAEKDTTIRYELRLIPSADNRLLLQERRSTESDTTVPLSAAAFESSMFRCHGIGNFPWHIYHFYDTTRLSDTRMSSLLEDCHYLRSMGENIASFLWRIKSESPWHYHDIVCAIQTAMPFFEDFDLQTYQAGPETKVRLAWRQKGCDDVMLPSQLSDGALRFICLTTALCQPTPPELMVFDEPELGLHPEAIEMVADMIESAATRSQMMVLTQSPQLLNHFAPDDIIVARRQHGASTYTRLHADDLKIWLEDYSLGELWQKNVIPGGSAHE